MRIGVFTSGGDAPGMNACIRAVVRAAIYHKAEVVGIRRGYEGLLEEDFYHSPALNERRMTLRSVSNIVQRGGTMLRTSRSEEFRTEVGLKKAANILRRNQIDGLVAIGGDGTFHGAVALAQHWDGKVIGCPGTIDNDLYGTDYTIGFDTAVNTAMEAIDKIRDTADATDRLFLIEVMGRDSGYIAVDSALAAGAEQALARETAIGVDTLIELLVHGRRRGKTSSMVIVAEGNASGGAEELQRAMALRWPKVTQEPPYDTRVMILGHLQRGGSPTARDRVLSSRLGAYAVQALMDGHTGKMAGEVAGQLALTPFQETWEKKKPIAADILKLLEILAL